MFCMESSNCVPINSQPFLVPLNLEFNKIQFKMKLQKQKKTKSNKLMARTPMLECVGLSLALSMVLNRPHSDILASHLKPSLLDPTELS